MSQPLRSINLVAPGFKGVNTEDSPIGADYSFAEIADNAVIDKFGRIASRKGVDLWTLDRTSLGDSRVNKVHHFFDDSGNEALFVTGNNKIFQVTSSVGEYDVLTDITPAGYTITSDNWKIVNFNDKAYFFRRGQEPLVYDDATGLRTFGDATGETTDTDLYCDEALSAYGRLFVVDNGADTQTVYWSDLLIGTDFSGGSSGSINVAKAWPAGHDSVVALVAHNDKLIIFGEHSILVYGNAFSPALMLLEDTVVGVGCICKNSVQIIGTDVLFMDKSGLRSFGRVIQEKSLPLADLSKNIKTDLINVLGQINGCTASAFSPEESFYLITFPEISLTYCFDLKGTLENGAFRVTRWFGAPFGAWCRMRDGRLITGTKDGVGEYSGYTDELYDPDVGEILPTSYLFRYYSPGLTFDDPSKLKFLKKIRPTIVGANSGTMSLKWAYDFEQTYKSSQFLIGNQVPYFYNTEGTEYTVAQYTGGTVTTRTPVNATGSGSVVSIGLETEINGFSMSLQEINVLALMGKIL